MPSVPSETSPASPAHLFEGPGEMRARCRELDWSTTPLGPVEQWPASLRTVAQNTLSHPFPNVVLWGPELVQIYNDGYRELMGVKHPTGLGQPTRACWPEVWHLNAPLYERVWAGESVAFEDALFPITRSGVLEDAWFSLSYSPVHDESGRVAGVLVTVFETTQRKRAETALRESEMRFRSLASASAHALYRMNADWSELHQLTGTGFLVDTQAPRRDWMQGYIPVDEQPLVTAAITEAVRTRTTFELEHRVRRADGTIGWTLSRAVPILDEQGEIREWFGAASDVTARREVDRLAEMRLRSDLALAAGSVGTFTWHIPTDGLRGDESFRHLFDLRVDASGSASLADYAAAIHPDDRAATMARLRQAVELGEPYEAEYRVVTGGQERWVVARGSVERDEEAQPLRLSAVLMDITDRRRAEEAQRLLTLRLETALSVARLGTFEWDLRNRQAVFDERARAMFAFAPGEESEVARVFDRIDPDERAAIEQASAQAIASSERLVRTYPIVLPDGTRRDVLSFGEILHGPDGQPQRMIGVFRDVTEERLAAEQRQHLLEGAQRARAEAEVARQQTERLLDQIQRGARRLRMVVDASGTGTWEMDLTTGAVLGDERFGVIYGLPSNGALTRDEYMQLVHETDRAALRQHLAAMSKGETTGHYQADYRIVRPSDQQVRWVENRGQLLRDAEGQPVRLIGTVVDSTDRKQADEALRTSEDRYRTLFESIDEGYCLIELIVDPQGQVVDYLFLEANSAFEAQTGLAAPVGKTIRQLAPTISTSWFEIYGRVAATGETARFENHDPALHRWFDAYADRVGPAEQRHVAIVFKDITQRKQVEQERERLLALETAARQQAEEASRIKDNFLATVSHELRTPLNAILGWLQMLRRGTLPVDRRERALETVERNARAQARLVEDLLDMSRILSGKMRLEVEPVEVARVVEAAIETVQPMAAARGVQLQPVLDADVRVMGDPHRLQQIVWNLLSNAVKFTPRGGQVQVLVRPGETSAEVIVSDSGQGMSEEFLPHAFERFRQAEMGLARAQGGLGLGLAIVKQLVELQGGTIEATSAGKDRGSSFTVRLPWMVASSPSGPTSALSPSPATLLAPAVMGELTGLRMLVVDDEPDTRELVATLLQGQGAQVAEASSAAEARQVFDEVRPDLVVSDIGMPGETGYDLIAWLRARSPKQGGQVPAIALTAYARSQDRTRALEAGFSQHVSKPVEPDELLAVVGSLARHIRRPGQ